MKNLLTVTALFTLFVTFSQTTYTNKTFDFTITIPESWYESFFEKGNSRKGFHEGSYYIANFGKTTSFLPKAVNARLTVEAAPNKQAGNFKEFKKVVDLSIKNNIKPQFKNFSIKQELTEITISGIKSLYAVYIYDFEMDGGWTAKVKNSMYIIPYKSNFFTIMCVDGQDAKYDVSEDFKTIIASIKIGR